MQNNKLITLTLILIVVGLLVTIIYLSVAPQAGDRFTEFYILSQDGRASNYPRVLLTGQSIPVIVGLVNHEGNPTSYRILITSNSGIINSIDTEIIPNGQQWERKVDIILNNPGMNRKIEFYLFLEGEDQPHIKDPLILITDVISVK